MHIIWHTYIHAHAYTSRPNWQQEETARQDKKVSPFLGTKTKNLSLSLSVGHSSSEHEPRAERPRPTRKSLRFFFGDAHRGSPVRRRTPLNSKKKNEEEREGKPH